MGQPTHQSSKCRFGSFELDRDTVELRKRGIRIKLQEQPYRILCALLDARGEVVSRDALCRMLWPADTFVEFERSLNAAMAKLRQALGDSADNPRFVETVARRGYRFIAPVEFDYPGVESPQTSSQGTPLRGTTLLDNTREASRSHRVFAVLTIAIALVSALAFWIVRRIRPESPPYTVLHRLTSDTGLTTDPAVSRDGSLLAYASDRGGGPLNIWVQQLTSVGTAIRLTHSDADDHQPSFSPDGTQVVFRSERDGGGIYVVPSLGGQPRLIAKEGRDPSFSPDGKWISYWVGNITYDSFNTGEVYFVPSSGGTPERLRTNLLVGYPVWSSDSRHVLVLGTRSISDRVDWWVFSRDGTNATETGGFNFLKQHGLPVEEYGSGFPPRASEWNGSDLLFSARFGDTVSTWTMRLSPTSAHAQGPVLRLSSGHEIEDHPHVLPAH